MPGGDRMSTDEIVLCQLKRQNKKVDIDWNLCQIYLI